MIKKLPLSISGLMLALAALGNLLFTYGYILQNIFGILSTVILFMMLAKIIICPKIIANELEDPINASMFPTFSMGIMLLSTYNKGHIGNISFIIWIIGLFLHIYLMIRFTTKFIKNSGIEKIFPSYFIVYSGIVVGSITAPVFNMQSIGKMLFYFGVICFAILLSNAIKNTFTKQMTKSELPTIAIFAAPLSIFLSGYLNSFQSKNVYIVYLLVIFSQLTLFLVLTIFPRVLRLKFHPSFSALTFPVVISAISLKSANGFLTIAGRANSFIPRLVQLEEILSILIVLYVLVRYIVYLLPGTCHMIRY